MNRRDLQLLSRIRKREAKVLFDAGNFAGGYYLLGYAVECAIKAAIAKQVRRYDFPDKRTVQDSYTHDLQSLMKTAALWNVLNAAMAASPALQLNWAVVKDWSEQSRYDLQISAVQARDFYSACTSRTNGLLSWLKNYW